MEISRGQDWKIQRVVFTHQGSPKAFVYADEGNTWRWFVSGEYAGGEAASLEAAKLAVEAHFGLASGEARCG